MSVRIDQNLCVGCRRCVEVCPGNLIRIGEDGKAAVRSIRDCWGCTSCMKECSTGAIDLFLGPDLEGRGTVLHVKKARTGFTWTCIDKHQKEKSISIDASQSNKY